MYPIVILCGGLATRLLPLTKEVPKSLIAIDGVPFIDLQLKYLLNQGFREFIFCIGNKAEILRRHLEKNHPYGVTFRFSYDGPVLVGTGGAINKAVKNFSLEKFFVMYGDSFLPINFREIQSHYQGLPPNCALMTVFRNTLNVCENNVDFRDGVVLSYDKANPSAEWRFIDFGLQIMAAENFVPFNDEHFDLGDVFCSLINNNLLFGREIPQRPYEIGSHQGMLEAEKYFRRK